MIRRVFVEEKAKTYHTPFSMEDIQSATEEGRRAERERISAMVENRVCFDNRDSGECEHSVCYGMIDLIALIKGENK
jgi:hypothetical protein